MAEEDNSLVTKHEFITRWHESESLVSLFARLGLHEEDIGEFYNLMDFDNSGHVDLGELAQSYLELKILCLDPNKCALLRGSRNSEERYSLLVKFARFII